jgi:predicted aspartyl protease
VQGLIDTGACGVCIDPSITQQLGLQPTGSCEMLTPSTGAVPQIAAVYDISIKIPHGGSSLDFDSIQP